MKVLVTEPPQAKGAALLLFVTVVPQPPVAVAEANHAKYFTLICDCVWQAASVTFIGQLNTTGVAGVTVKVRVQVTGASQSLVTVKVTVEVPPQAFGVPGLLFVNTRLQPPLAVAVANQAAYFVLICAWVWQAASVTFIGQVKFTTGAVATVNVRVQVTGTWQVLVTVKVTVAVPPQALGTPVLLFVSVVPQPPEAVAMANHAAYLVSI